MLKTPIQLSAILVFALCFTAACELLEDESKKSDVLVGAEVGADVVTSDTKAETSVTPAAVLEARTEAFENGMVLVAEADGSVLAMGPVSLPDVGYGPSLGVARIAVDGSVSASWAIDPGAPTFAYDAVLHPAGGVLAVGSTGQTAGPIAWAARLDLSAAGSVTWQTLYGDGGQLHHNEFRAVVAASDGFGAYGYGDPSAGGQRPMMARVSLDGGMSDPSFLWVDDGQMIGSFSDAVRSGTDELAVGFRADYVPGVGYEGPSMAYPSVPGGASPIALPDVGLGIYGVAFYEGDVVVVAGLIPSEDDPEAPSILVARLKRDGLDVVWSMTIKHKQNDVPIGLDAVPGGPIAVISNSFDMGEVAHLSLIDGAGNLLEQKRFEHRVSQAIRMLSPTELVIAGFAERDPDVENDTRPSGWVARVHLD